MSYVGNPMKLGVLIACGALAIGSFLQPAAAFGQESVTVTGYATVVADAPRVSLMISTSRGHVGVQGADLPADIRTGDLVSVPVSDASGGAIDWSPTKPDVVVATGPVVEVPRPGRAAAQALPGPTDAQLILVRASWPGTPIARAGDWDAIRLSVSGTDSYWRESSNGSLSVTATREIDDVVLPRSPCASSDLGEDAGAIAAGAAGLQYPLSANTHLVFFTPPCADSGWSGVAGFGTIGASIGSGGWIAILGADSVNDQGIGNNAGVLAHEFGHNLGLGHSNELACSIGARQVPDAAPAACKSYEYYGVYSVMGISWMGFGPPALPYGQRRQLGMVADGSTVTVSGTALRDYSLSPLAGGSGVRTLLLPDPSTGDTYALEYRAGVGLDGPLIGNPMARMWLPPGIVVTKIFGTARLPFQNDNGSASDWSRIWTADNAAYLLDMNPASNPQDPNFLNSETFDGDPVLVQGQRVRLGPWDLSLVGISTAATVRVGPIGSFPPSRQKAPVTLVPRTGAMSGGQVKIVWKASGANNYRVVWVDSPTGPRLMSRLPAGSATFSGLGWNRRTTWRVDACTSLGACVAGTPAVVTTAPLPVTVTTATGRVGDRRLSWRLSGGTPGSTWRVYWCNTRVSGRTCDPLTASTRAYSASRTGAATLALNMGARVCTVGKQSCSGSWKRWRYRSGDGIRFTVLEVRQGRQTVGLRIGSGMVNGSVVRP